jgi:hypothetical protein
MPSILTLHFLSAQFHPNPLPPSIAKGNNTSAGKPKTSAPTMLLIRLKTSLGMEASPAGMTRGSKALQGYTRQHAICNNRPLVTKSVPEIRQSESKPISNPSSSRRRLPLTRRIHSNVYRSLVVAQRLHSCPTLQVCPTLKAATMRTLVAKLDVA